MILLLIVLRWARQALHGENEVRVFVDSPSTQDHEDTVASLAYERRFWEEKLERHLTRKRCAKDGLDKALTDKEFTIPHTVKAQLQELSRKERAITNSDRGFGEVVLLTQYLLGFVQTEQS